MDVLPSSLRTSHMTETYESQALDYELSWAVTSKTADRGTYDDKLAQDKVRQVGQINQQSGNKMGGVKTNWHESTRHTKN